MLKLNNMNNKEKAINIGENNLDKCFGSKRDYGVTCALEMARWKDEQAKQLYNIIIKLWDMLDWIDTYADLKINGSESDVYFSKIENKTKERFDFVKSDGYDLFINEQKITNYERNTTKTD